MHVTGTGHRKLTCTRIRMIMALLTKLDTGADPHECVITRDA